MIDVIIPAYNSHSTIKKTLQSICLQNIKHMLNVVIVDDCSDVDYQDEVDLFSKMLNIRQIRLEKNSGPGVARQVAIDNTDGEYITFIDADDLFANCYSLQFLYDAAIEYQADLTVGIMIHQESKNEYYRYQNHEGCLYGKLYRRSFILDKGIRFTDTRNCEDDGFNKAVLMANPVKYFVEYETYYYINSANSITRKDNGSNHFNTLEKYAYNIGYAAHHAIDNNFDTHEIAHYVTLGVTYLYCNYLNYFRRADANKILGWAKDLVSIYSVYKYYITEEEKKDIFNEFNFESIPIISFNEFLNRVLLYSE